jgi:hypothetical protein
VSIYIYNSKIILSSFNLDGNLGKALWQKEGNQVIHSFQRNFRMLIVFFFKDNKWLFGRISLLGNIEQAVGQPYQLVIEGIVGNGFQGDISVDDLAVNEGPCPASSKI